MEANLRYKMTCTFMVTCGDRCLKKEQKQANLITVTCWRRTRAVISPDPAIFKKKPWFYK